MKAGTKVVLGAVLGGAVIGVATAIVRGRASTSSKVQAGRDFGSVRASVPGVREFDRASNKVFIAPDCSFAIVGERFLEDPESSTCATPWRLLGGEYSLRQALEDGHQLCSFLYYLVDHEQITDPAMVLVRVVEGLDLPCLDVPTTKWTPAMRELGLFLKRHVEDFIAGWEKAA